MSIRTMTLTPLLPTAAERTKAIIADYRTAPMIEFAIEAAYREGARAVLAMLAQPNGQILDTAIRAVRKKRCRPVYGSCALLSHHEGPHHGYPRNIDGIIEVAVTDALRAAAAHLGEDKP